MVLDQRPLNQTADPVTVMLPQTLRALKVAQETDDKGLEAELERDVGARTMQDPVRSDAHNQRALQIFREIGDLVGEANAYRSLSNTASVNGRPQVALDYARSGVSAARRAERTDTEALLLVAMTASLAESEDWQEVIAVGSEAFEVIARCRLDYLRSTLAANMANAFLHLGMLNESVAAAAAALQNADEFPGGRYDRYEILAILAKSALGCGMTSAAAGACEQFEAMMTESDQPEDKGYFGAIVGRRNRTWIREVRMMMSQSLQ